MTLAINFPPELEQELAREAARAGQSLPEYALQVLQRSVGSSASRAAGRDQNPEGPPADTTHRRPEGLAEGVIILGPRFDEPLPRELLAKFGL